MFTCPTNPVLKKLACNTDIVHTVFYRKFLFVYWGRSKLPKMCKIAVFCNLSKTVSAILIFPGGIIKIKWILKFEYIFSIFWSPPHPSRTLRHARNAQNRVFFIFLKICSLDLWFFHMNLEQMVYMQYVINGILPKILICALSALKVAKNA